MATSATAQWVANNNSPGFPSSPPNPPPSKGGAHTRTYQACTPCRDRKVKCNMGPVDNPNGPPCVRCRRESKQCYFSETRRKRKAADVGDENAQRSGNGISNGPRRFQANDLDGHFITHQTPTYASPYPRPQDMAGPSSSQHPAPPFTPVDLYGHSEPLRRPILEQSPVANLENQNDVDRAAAMLQSREVFSGHDALHLLAEASRRTADMRDQTRDVRDRTGSMGSTQQRGSFAANQSPAGNYQGTHQAESPLDMRPHSTQAVHFDRSFPANNSAAIDPAIAAVPTNGILDDEDHMQLASKAWSRFRFVRAGWFTAKEGIAYVEYFYKYLFPLTPITVPNFQHPSTHARLLAEEPMLAVTILMISSRYKLLSGPGASTRLHYIHGQLWRYLESMISRMILGQEQFGGGFCGAGSRNGSDVDPLSRKGLRTLGTVESLLLLTEWHPQALHFPPGDDSDELLVSNEANISAANGEAAAAGVEEVQRGIGGRRMDAWLEPCWRSDRMCWMLLGIALSLSYEIGVFDEAGLDELPQDNALQPRETRRLYLRRRENVKELLLVYITQTSGRLGLTSMLPKPLSETPSLNKTPASQYEDRMAQMLRTNSQDGVYAGHITDGTAVTESVQVTVLSFWLEIASIMNRGNHHLFPSRRQTRDLIKSGRYVDLLQDFQPLLRLWRRNFDQAQNIPTHMRHILTIEYEYCRVYINSLALQAVVERCANNTPSSSAAELPTAHQPNAPHITGGGIPFSTLKKWLGGDQPRIQEVVDACRSLLTVVVDGLYPGNYLRHAPVRTYFRIISVALILLKTFVLGSTEHDATLSLGLMERAVIALRTCIVDDVHVGNQFANLLETLTNRVKSCFVRLAANSNGISRAASRSPAPPLDHEPKPINGATGTETNYLGPPQQSMNESAFAGARTPQLSAGHPLYETYSSNNFTFMPPTTSGFLSGFDDHNLNTANDAFLDENGNLPDWLVLPLDPLLNMNSADVTQTTYGPDVGGFDLLELLLNGQGVDGMAENSGI